MIRAPVGEQSLEHLALCRGFDEQGTEQGVQAGAIQRWLERKQLFETGDVGRADWHTVDTQGGKEIAKFRQGRGLSGGIVRTQSARLDVHFIAIHCQFFESGPWRHSAAISWDPSDPLAKCPIGDLDACWRRLTTFCGVSD